MSRKEEMKNRFRDRNVHGFALRRLCYRVCPVCALVLSLLLSSAATFACDWEAHEKMKAEAEIYGYEEYYDVSTWVQWDSPKALGIPLGDGTSGANLGNDGCSYCAATFMLYRMGLIDVYKGENYFTTWEKMTAAGAWLTWGKMDYTRIGEVFPGVVCHTYKAPIPGGTLLEQEAFMKQKMEEGYFIILTIMGSVGEGGHYIFVDTILDDGDMILGDASYWAINWNGYHGINGGYIVDYSLFTYDGMTPGNTESIYVKNAPEVEEIREQRRIAHIHEMMNDIASWEEKNRYNMFSFEDNTIACGSVWMEPEETEAAEVTAEPAETSVPEGTKEETVTAGAEAGSGPEEPEGTTGPAGTEETTEAESPAETENTEGTQAS